jgi:AraC family transcriptional regulator
MYGEPINVTDIAANAYLSPSYFSFMFRTFTGYTVKNYLNRYRLYRAALELKDDNKSLVEIAYLSGFSSQQAFTRSFSQMYGIAPAQFRLTCPDTYPFPPDNLWTKWREPSMELMDCFEKVGFVRKEAFYVVGLEVDINYNTSEGTDPIGGLWERWSSENIEQTIPDQVAPDTVYGLTHSEIANNTAKYMVGVEVGTLDNLPVGLVARKFDACDYAVFNTTLEILWTGEFWRTFYAKWLPSSGYALPDSQIRETYPTFNKYPDLEVYRKDCGEGDVFQIYAPVVKK